MAATQAGTGQAVPARRYTSFSCLAPLSLSAPPHWAPPPSPKSMLRRAAAAASPRRAAACSSTRASRSIAAAAAAAPVAEEVAASCATGGLGTITLRRERQLNALGAAHVEAMAAVLREWGAVAVLLDSCSAKAFCSGGDVKAVRQAVLEQPYTDVPPPGHHIHRVFAAEYATLLAAAGHPLPLVAVCDGIWMGLGFGLAGWGRRRIVTERTVFAMPENHIGLWPDVGFAFKAAHMPGHLGLLVGLSGVRLSSPADLLYARIATHFMPSEQLQAFKQQLHADPSALEQLLQRHSQAAPDGPAGPLQRLQPLLDRHCRTLLQAWRDAGGDEQRGLAALAALREQLQQELPNVHHSDHQAAHLLHNIIGGLQYGSPRSQLITLQHFSRVAHAVAAEAASPGGAGPPEGSLATLQGVMHMEYRMAVRQVAHVDFLEGVRAALVDKDRQPAWLQQGQQQGQQQPLPGNAFPVEQLFHPVPGLRSGHLMELKL